MRVPLEGQVQVYWRTCLDLQLVRAAGDDDRGEIEELFDLAGFTDSARLRVACLSRLKCDVSHDDSLSADNG